MRNLIFFLCLTSTYSSYGQETEPLRTPPDLNDKTWVLHFEDDFNDNSIDATKWHIFHQFDHYGANDIVFLNQNVSETGGNMVLTFKKENYTCTGAHQCARQTATGLSYTRTSGYIATKPSVDFRYGYIEARIKLTYDYGLFPALWTLQGWNTSAADGYNSSEIDIFEMQLGSQQGQHRTTTNIHYAYDDPNTPENEHLPEPAVFYDPIIGNYNNIYRVFGLEWDEHEIIWYVDGISYRVFENPAQSDDDRLGIHDVVKLILDLAIQKNYEPNSSTPSTSQMLIDYVKIYQRNGYCNTNSNLCFLDYNTFDHAVRNSIHIGASGCGTTTLPSNANLYLDVINQATIYGTFTVPLGATMTIQIVEEEDCYIIDNTPYEDQ